MSLLQTRSGASGVKSLASRFSATGRLCLLSVVTTNFLLCGRRLEFVFFQPV
jgi:hypothetical protein